MSDEKPESRDRLRDAGAEHVELPPGALLSPAAERNKAPLLEVLSDVLPASGLVLEVASGTGQHVAHFARVMHGLKWQPSDPDPEMRKSIRAHAAAHALDNVAEPLDLDVLAADWPLSRADAVLCCNMIHIAPWSATEGLLRGVGTLLEPAAPFVLYGPFMRDGCHTSPSNERFDTSLKQRNSAWGIRDLEVVTALAEQHGLVRAQIVPMPANNSTVVFRKN